MLCLLINRIGGLLNGFACFEIVLCTWGTRMNYESWNVILAFISDSKWTRLRQNSKENTRLRNASQWLVRKPFPPFTPIPSYPTRLATLLSNSFPSFLSNKQSTGSEHSHTVRFPLRSIRGKANPLPPRLPSSFPLSVSASNSLSSLPTESPCTQPFNASSTMLINSSIVTALHLLHPTPTIITHRHHVRFLVQKPSRESRFRALAARADRARTVF